MALTRFLLSASTFAAALAAQMPPIPVPAENPITPAKTVLGKILFWDEQLSSDDSTACGTCHVPEYGGGDPRFALGLHPGPDGVFATDDDIVGSPGIARQAANGDFKPDAIFGMRRQVTGRAANSNLGAAYHRTLFWDGRAASTFVDPETNQVVIPNGGALESQAIGPILSPVEMGWEGRTWHDVRHKLQTVRPLKYALSLTPDIQTALASASTYQELFEAAFGDPSITAARIGMALATYQRTLQPDLTPWDRYIQGQADAMTPEQIDGWNLFNGIARCHACHPAPLFHDDDFHNLGLRFRSEDRGLGAITNNPDDDGKFKTPGLRNAGLRPRLFHNGQSPSLHDPEFNSAFTSVRHIYEYGGGSDRENVSPLLLRTSQLGVSSTGLDNIMDFVASALTDPRAAEGLPPFDHPRLRSLELAPPRRFGQESPSGNAPFLIDTVPSSLGNLAWKVGVSAPEGTRLAFLGFGTQSIEPTANLGGLPLNVRADVGYALILEGAPGNPAHGTWRLPIPQLPGLSNLSLYFQVWTLNATGPQTFSTSRGVEFVFR